MDPSLVPRLRRVALVLSLVLGSFCVEVCAQDVAAAGGVPEVVGLSAKDAGVAITAAGYTAKFSLGDPPPSADKALTVYAVNPAPGTVLAGGGVVNVTLYSRSPDVAVLPPPPGAASAIQPGDSVRVPEVVGLPAKDALAALSAAGLIAKFQLGKAAPSPAEEFTIYAQDPPPVGLLSRRQVVHLSVYARPSPSAASAGSELTQVVAVPFLDREEQSIDPRTGRLSLSVVDLAVQAGAVPLEVRRTLVPPSGKAGLLGSRWRLNWECRVEQSGSRALIDDGGRPVLLTLNEALEQYESEGGDVLVFDARHTVWTTPDGRRRTFDEPGRLVEFDEHNGNLVRLSYDEQGRLARVDGPCGVSLQFTTDDSGRLTRVDSSTGASASYTCSTSGAYLPEQVASVPAAGYATRYEYDPTGALAKIVHPRFGTMQFTYDPKGRVTARTLADGAAERYAYAAAARTVRLTDPLGQVTTISWSADGAIEETITPLGQKIVVQSDAAGRPVAVTGPTGQTARLAYDRLGRVISAESPATGVIRTTYLGDTRLPASIVGPGGDRQSFEYDAQGNLLRLTNALDPVQNVSIEYQPDGLVRQITRGNGERQTFTYDESGRRTSVADAAGNLWKFEYDACGNVVRETDPLGGVTSRAYDEHGLLASLTDPAGATIRFSREQRGNTFVISTTDPRGGVTRSTYNQRGQLVSVTDPAQRTTRYDYDPAGRLVRRTDPAGQTTQYQYDPVGNIVGEINSGGAMVRRTLDAMGRVTSRIDPSGAATSFEYSPAGRLTRLVDPAGLATTFAYDPQGRLTATTDLYGSTQQERLPSGRIARVIPPTGPVITYEYDPQGRVSQVQRGGRLVAAYEYDPLGRVAKETQAGGLELTYRYDPLGRLISLEDNQGGRQSIEYDATGRPVATTDANGAVTRLSYDAVGNLTGASDPLGHAQALAYDAADQLAEVIEPNGDRARYDYDLAGRLAAVRRPGGGQSSYSYDASGNPLTTIDPLGKESRAAYDAAGRLMSATDAEGRTTRYTYDAAGRLTEKRLADGTAVRSQYDHQGRLIRVDDGTFPVLYAYDARGNVIRIEYPAIRRTLSYEYNDLGLKTRFVDSEGRTTLYEYDDADRLASLRVLPDSPITFAYDAHDRPTSVAFPNGVKGTWLYDPNGRPLKITYVNAAGQTVAGWSCAYDASGNRVETVAADGRAARYSYDANGQLVQEDAGGGQVTRYTYLPGGNRGSCEQNGQTVKSTYDAADRLLTCGDESFAYDANGSLIERKGPRGVTRYSYDAQDRLVKVSLPGGGEVTYGYAPTGERIWRRDSGGLTWFVTDGVHRLAELGEDLRVRAQYLHGESIDQPLAMSRDGETAYFHADFLGSIAALTDPRGVAIGQYEYDAFGQCRPAEGSVPCPFTFTGREYDPATGLYDYRARDYDASLGRFLTVDPAAPDVTKTLTLNPYLYAYNAPTRYVDPWGAAGEEPPNMIPKLTNQGIYDYLAGRNAPEGSLGRQRALNELNARGLPPEPPAGGIPSSPEPKRPASPGAKNPTLAVPKAGGANPSVRAGTLAMGATPAPPQGLKGFISGAKEVTGFGTPQTTTFGSAVKGAGVVGVVTTIGHAGIDYSEGKPIGDIAWDTAKGVGQGVAVTAGAGAIGAGIGATVGSIVPVIGTAVGAGAGWALGTGTVVVAGAAKSAWDLGGRIWQKAFGPPKPPVDGPPPTLPPEPPIPPPDDVGGDKSQTGDGTDDVQPLGPPPPFALPPIVQAQDDPDFPKFLGDAGQQVFGGKENDPSFPKLLDDAGTRIFGGDGDGKPSSSPTADIVQLLPGGVTDEDRDRAGQALAGADLKPVAKKLDDDAKAAAAAAQAAREAWENSQNWFPEDDWWDGGWGGGGRGGMGGHHHGGGIDNYYDPNAGMRHFPYDDY